MSIKGKKVAETILKIRRSIIDNSETKNPNSWELTSIVMGYRDSLEAMKRGKLISNYNLADDTAEG